MGTKVLETDPHYECDWQDAACIVWQDFGPEGYKPTGFASVALMTLWLEKGYATQPYVTSGPIRSARCLAIDEAVAEGRLKRVRP